MGSNKPRTLEQVLDFMYENSIHDYETDCWLWQRLTSGKGYGQIYFEGKTQSIHRISYACYVGEIKDGVFHKCDRPNCWNPEHLFTGTINDNIQDAVSKGRHQKGERSGNAKLTEKHVLEIRASELSCGQLAKVYGVCSMTIWHAKIGRTWRHI